MHTDINDTLINIESIGFTVNTPIIPAEESSPGHTRYLVDANGNVQGVYQQGKLVTGNTVASKQLSIAGQGSGFDIIQWFKDLWKSIFGG